jgi:hypothetical protein
MQEITKKSSQALTAADWIKLCQEWEQSGEPQQVFCEIRKINYTTFVYWRMKVKKAKQPLTPTVFSTVAIKQPVGHPASFKIHLPNGIGLTVPLLLDKAPLKNLFECLGVC